MRVRSANLRGFTLIELLVAISIMALMAVLSWRGLDAMSQTQTRLQLRADEVLALQAGLAQWGADLDALQVLPTLQALDWDGRALRLTRRASASWDTSSSANSRANTNLLVSRTLAEAVMVVAWSRRDVNGTTQWLRWQSPPLQNRGDVQTAWAQAAQWAQNPGDDLKAREVTVVPLAQWQVFFFRNDAWTNPLSAAGNVAASPGGTTPSSAGAIAASVASAIAGLPAQTGVDTSVPQGVRLVLTLPEGHAISGNLTRDWIQPTLGGGKS